MIGREKVIKGLECCKMPFSKCYDGGCPYFEDEGCKAKLKREALELLKAQEEKVVNLTTKIAELTTAQEPIVHCKDCKHYDRRCFTCENDVLLIKIDDCGCHPPFRVDDDWYCADVERRESDG